MLLVFDVIFMGVFPNEYTGTKAKINDNEVKNYNVIYSEL